MASRTLRFILFARILSPFLILGVGVPTAPAHASDPVRPPSLALGTSSPVEGEATLRPTNAGLEDSPVRRALESQLAAGLEEPESEDGGLRITLKIGEEVVFWNLDPEAPHGKIIHMRFEGREGGRANVAFSADESIGFIAEPQWDRGVPPQPQGRKGDSEWTLEPEKRRKNDPPTRGLGVVVYDFKRGAKIGAVSLRRWIRRSRAEFRLAVDSAVKLHLGVDYEDILLETVSTDLRYTFGSVETTQQALEIFEEFEKKKLIPFLRGRLSSEVFQRFYRGGPTRFDSGLREAVINLMEHGRGGALELYLIPASAGEQGYSRMIVRLKDAGPGLQRNLNDLLQESESAHAGLSSPEDLERRGLGWKNIADSADAVTVESNGGKWALIKGLPPSSPRFERNGTSSVTRGTVLTLTYESPFRESAAGLEGQRWLDRLEQELLIRNRPVTALRELGRFEWALDNGLELQPEELERLARVLVRARFRFFPNAGDRAYRLRAFRFLKILVDSDDTVQLRLMDSLNRLSFSFHRSLYGDSLTIFREAFFSEEDRMISEIYKTQAQERLRRPHLTWEQQLRRDGITVIAPPPYARLKEMLEADPVIELTLDVLNAKGMTPDSSLDRVLVVTRSMPNEAASALLTTHSRKLLVHGHSHPLGMSELSRADHDSAILMWTLRRKRIPSFMLAVDPVTGTPSLWVYQEPGSLHGEPTHALRAIGSEGWGEIGLPLWFSFVGDSAVASELETLGVAASGPGTGGTGSAAGLEGMARIGDRLIPSAGLEVDGLTWKDTGEIASGLEAILEPGGEAIVVPVADQQAAGVLAVSAGIRELQASLTDEIQVVHYGTPELARVDIQREAPDLLLVTPEEFARGGWGGLNVPTAVLPAAVAAGLNRRDLAAIAAAARVHGILHINGVTQAGLEEQGSVVVLQMT